MKPLIAQLKLPVHGWGLQVQSNGSQITGIDFIAGDCEEIASTDAVLSNAISQLRYYMDDPAYPFDLPLRIQGTPFQCRVWDALRRLRVGETQTYGMLARRLETSARAVGGACRSNPLAIVVPCHRIVGQHGLGGFSGTTRGSELQVKQWLLQHEDQNRRYRSRSSAA